MRWASMVKMPKPRAKAEAGKMHLLWTIYEQNQRLRLVPRNVGHLSLPSLLSFYLQLTVIVPSTYYQLLGNQPNWGRCSCCSSSLGVWVSIRYPVSHTFIHWRYFCFLSNRTPKANHEIKKSSKNHPEIQEKSIKISRNPGLCKLTAERD